jgi:hypothetical protein
MVISGLNDDGYLLNTCVFAVNCPIQTGIGNKIEVFNLSVSRLLVLSSGSSQGVAWWVIGTMLLN